MKFVIIVDKGREKQHGPNSANFISHLFQPWDPRDSGEGYWRLHRRGIFPRLQRCQDFGGSIR